MDTKPTHEQAQLNLQLYDLRREARMRQARDWFFKNYHAENFDQAMKIAAMGTEAGASFMQVVSYWEQACALLNSGLLSEELFFLTSGEFFGVWERLKPSMPEARQRFVNPTFASEIEKAAKKYEAWMEKRAPGHIAAMREWMKQMTAQQTAAAKA